MRVWKLSKETDHLEEIICLSIWLAGTATSATIQLGSALSSPHSRSLGEGAVGHPPSSENPKQMPPLVTAIYSLNSTFTRLVHLCQLMLHGQAPSFFSILCT